MKNRIRATREAKGWSLEVLAVQSGTTNQQISLLETGKRRLTVDWLARLAKVLSCHPWELVASDLPKQSDPDEIRLLDRFRRLAPSQQQAVLTLVDTMTVSISPGARRKKAA